MPSVGQIDDRENETLEKWLAQRNLDSLLLEQLESRLESTSNAASREEIAKRLAELYGNRLLSPDGDPQQLLKRTRELIALYPRFETGRLRVAILHARYIESEKLFRQRIQTGGQFEKQVQLESVLQTLHEDLSGALTALMRRSEELFAAGQLSRDQRNLESERQTIEAEALHCQFLAGWSGYFLAMLRQDEQEELLDQAEVRFREFLQLDPQTLLSDYDSRWFDFQSAWHVRAIAGLAAIEAARDNQAQSLYLYKLIESNAVSRESREAVIRFRFLGNCYCGKYELATNVVRDRKRIASMSRAGRIRLWLTVMETTESAGTPELRTLALAGLTRNMAGELLVAEIEKSDVAANEDSFESRWVSGYAEFWKSENGEPQAAEKAHELLQQAVSLGVENGDADDVARCRYLLAWLMLKQNQTADAISVFAQVAQQLASADPRLASESAWLAAKSSVRLGGRDPGKLNDAWNRLERFVRTWPDSPHANRANFEKLKIELRSMQPADAIRRLQDFPPGDENYAAALLEKAAQHYRLWQNQADDPETFARFQESCEDVNSSRETTAGQKLRASFFMIDAALRKPPLELASLDLILARCELLLDQVEDPEIAAAELLYYRMQIANQKRDVEASFEAASRLADIGKETRFELPALIQLAQHLDARLKQVAGTNGDPSAVADLVSEAVTTYQRLSNRLGRKSETLKSSANARVALSRLGELHQRAGDSRESERIFEQLLGQFPGNANYLRNLAIAKGSLDRSSAKELWQRLANGSQAGSDLWFEAKLELAKNLSSLDRDAASKLLRQTLQLGGDVPPHWQRSYDAMIEQLGSEGDR
ncbi:hypothetical protein MFFC18_02100 [Mariniblastus fucicola]|uniref:Tetratricopeptide repeat protein n=2 Tax=Mariniblastus fucicola TaxID=980251 RepID=A0A5B9PB73_9BACT|nr:hypothetical protein MFFC18_02100 [Mariniblastus fucicola]